MLGARLRQAMPSGIPAGRMLPLAWAAARHELWRARCRLLRSSAAASLLGKSTGRLRIAPPDIRSADRAIAHDICGGYFLIAGHAVTVSSGQSPFTIQDAHPDWRSGLHAFAWLRHLRIAQDETSAQRARDLIVEWAATNTASDPLAWSVETTARRVISWLSHAPMFLDGVSTEQHAQFIRSLTAQVALLEHALFGGPAGKPRLQAAIAVTMATLCLGAKSSRIDKAGLRLGAEIDRQVYGDGGHISRDPSAVADLLLDILPLRQTYLATSIDPPARLMNAIERMMPMVRFFRHRDGTLAHFNGTGASSTADLATLLAYDDAHGEPLRSAPHSGYERLTGLGATIILDTGRAPPAELSGHAHAGTLAFEFSTHSGHLIVNCGANHRLGSRWAEVCRSTAAHSTATLNDSSSARFAHAGWITDRFGRVILEGPGRVRTERADTSQTHSISARHDGYVARFGTVHQRKLILAADGTRLDGEDSFLAHGNAEEAAGGRFAIRFHLHPAVEVTTTQVGGLQLRVGNREVWGVFADGAVITLEDSIFVNGPEAPRKTKQIVLSGSCHEHPSVHWSFIRSDHRPPAPLPGDGAS